MVWRSSRGSTPRIGVLAVMPSSVLTREERECTDETSQYQWATLTHVLNLVETATARSLSWELKMQRTDTML